ncbi:MAG: YggS family pyridoxal phosphate-dependent enzyme [Defluviitaleaceae bacterium]|nr:YggS family pyridoxal phosphate-dependent enzyme [Defluviitaleaceae bacterium]
MVSQNVIEVRKRIAEAAYKSNRNPEDITLIGVTKTVSVLQIQELMQAGVTHLGENRVQDFVPKYAALEASNPTWHFIGHLQRNKTKQVVGKASLIHSIDSLDLAREIDKRAKQANRTANILVEINVANEPTKHGIPAESAKEFSKYIFELPNVRFCGLMCVAPFVENSEKNRSYFAKMRDLLRKNIFEKSVDNEKIMPYTHAPFTAGSELSMGMSNDFLIAIEEGATMVRIGTALVGKRM